MKNGFRIGHLVVLAVVTTLVGVVCIGIAGCGGANGYSSESLYPAGVRSVYVEMFESKSFRRGIEYELSNALAKRIEAETPYKVVSSRDKADTVIGGQILSAEQSILTTERETGRALEKEVELRVRVNWKNLKTGELLIDNSLVTASATYSEWQNQSFDYASTVAANSVAQRIVRLMEKPW